MVQDPPHNQLQLLINLYNEKQFDNTLHKASLLLAEFPNSPILYNIIGTVNKELGYLDEAIMAYEQSISIKPNNAEAHYNAGNALAKQGKIDHAIAEYDKAVSIKPNYIKAHYNKAILLQQLGHLDLALEAYRKAISNNPEFPEAYNNIGNVFKEKNHLSKALEAYQHAIAMKPDYAEALNNVGVVLKEQNKIHEAIIAYKKAISIEPNFTEAHNNLGNAFNAQNNLGCALQAYEKAILINPNFAEGYYNIGSILEEQGHIDQAQQAYNKAVTLKPKYAEAHRALSLLKISKPGDACFAQIASLLADATLSHADEASLKFALAKMYEDIGDLDLAFKYLCEGNSRRREILKYSFNEDVSLFQNLKKTQPFLLESKIKKSQKMNQIIPIFILGMPRSGTSLVEQIISSHPTVTGAGELTSVFQYGFNLATNSMKITQGDLEKFRANYLTDLNTISNGKNIITDKMPHNFRFIPLICAAFPEAKIIHTKRNAAATCWSNFKHYFASNGLGYSYDLEDVVAYYDLYADLMGLWMEDYSDQIYTLNYEKLTIDQEAETKALIQYLDLEWDEACLSPQNNRRNVRTASKQQVRQKVYQRSSEAWRKYEPFLGNLFSTLSHD